jgi:hypothetical protein
VGDDRGGGGRTSGCCGGHAGTIQALDSST